MDYLCFFVLVVTLLINIMLNANEYNLFQQLLMFRRFRSNYFLIIACIAICTLFLFTLSSRRNFESIPVRSNTQKESQEETNEVLRVISDIDTLLLLGRFDTTGKYKILPYIVIADHWQRLSKRPVCIGLQSSLDRLFNLVEFTEHWPGAISVAILAPGVEFFLTLYYVEHLRHCYPAIRQQVTLHIIYPMDSPPIWEKELNNETLSMIWDCIEEPKNVLDFLLSLRSNKTIEWRNKLVYPQNLLRNVAREHCQGEWVMCPDIDMLFPLPNPKEKSTIDRLEAFLRTGRAVRCGDKCAFVFPVYEIHENCDHIPSDKTQLLHFIKDKRARQYHVTVFKNNQAQSTLSKWEKINPQKEIKIAYPIAKFKFWYEPVYIAKRGTPKFDERYLGFGMVRNTQAFEMSLAGYKFFLLDNIFLSHWKFQEKKTHSAARRHQNVVNFKLFYMQHVRELAVRYNSDPENLLNRYRKRAERQKALVKQKYNIEVLVKTTEKPGGNTSSASKPMSGPVATTMISG